ncbi:MAG: hypothetical protein ABI945_01510 [Nitrospirales bacterium]
MIDSNRHAEQSTDTVSILGDRPLKQDLINVYTIGLPPEGLYPELVTFTHLNPNPVLVLDVEGHVRYLNLAARQVQEEFGLADADILTILPTNIVEIMRQCLESGTQVRR